MWCGKNVFWLVGFFVFFVLGVVVGNFFFFVFGF